MPPWTDSLPARMEALTAVPYLTALPAAELRELAGAAVVKRLSPGELLFQEGDRCDGLWVIAAGEIRILKLSPSGREQVLHSESAGALGEAPLLDGEPYPASARAAVESVLLFLPKATVLEWCRRSPTMTLEIAATLARRVRRFAALAESLALHQVGQRLASYLLERSAEAGSGAEIVLRESNSEIAARIGTVRELVSRLLGELRRQGLIRVTGRRITILDLGRLRRRAEPELRA